MNKTLKIEFPSDILIALNKSENELLYDMKLFTAIRFYTEGKLTLGKASQLIGISRIEFENILSKNNVPISLLEIEDIEKDINKLEIISNE